MLNPNLVLILLFCWMLFFWTVQTYNDTWLSKFKLQADSINKSNQVRSWFYVIVGGIFLILIIVSMIFR